MPDQNFPDLNDEDYSATFKALKITRTAMVVGCLLFLGVMILLTEVLKKNIAMANELSNILLIVCISFAFISFFIRQNLFRKRMQVITDESDFKKKTDQFRSTVIISFALIEFPALFSIICYFLTGNQLFIGLCLLIIAQFATIRLNLNSI